MQSSPIDPAPRSYASFVQVRRRSRAGRAAAPETTTIAEIETWLLSEAMAFEDFMTLAEAFFWRIVAAGAPLNRASLHVGTLHPQLAGYSWNWLSSDELMDELVVMIARRDESAYIRSPLYAVFEHGETVRGDPRDPAARARFPLFDDLHEQGVTDYIARPVGSRKSRSAATIGTFAPSGFSEAEVASLHRLFDLFSLHTERHMQTLVSRNIVDAYLGGTAGGDVLEGSIRRGDGRALDAVVWASDLRGFSEKADRLSPEETTTMLNLYFEALTGAVMDHGGDVLKFIGDGLLAVFPVASAGAEDAARRAVAAARDGLDRTDALNAAPPEGLVADALPLKSGVGLHLGEVFFGNVGAPGRLDFTVIGRAVNEASRVEGLCKTLGREILLTEPVAALLGGGRDGPPDAGLEDLGAHALKGVAAPMPLFAVTRKAAP